MKERPWIAVIPSAERTLYQKDGYGFEYQGDEVTLGTNVCLLIIDVTKAFLASCHRLGILADAAGTEYVARVAALLEAFRDQGRLVVHVTFDSANERFLGASTKRGLSRDNRHARDNEIADRLKPLPDEFLLRKSKASAFFGTPLNNYLSARKVDTLIVTGTTTSGCIRATVIDAFSLNYRVIVAEEGVMDRGTTAHLVNLFDMNAKYGLVVPVEVLLAQLRASERTIV